MPNRKRPTKKVGQLSDGEKDKMIKGHEDGDTIYELGDRYGVKPRSVAAYVANAHR